jgi:mRNA deadenylase 3'-5' endonuclease subunit Ccr4
MSDQQEAMILGHPPFTNYTGDFKETLDYIFHSPQ